MSALPRPIGWLVLATLGCTPSDGTSPNDTDADADTDADSDTDTDSDTDADVPATYEFESRFVAGSSVSYSGQVLRHLLINDLKTHLGGLTGRLDTGFFPVAGEVGAELDFYFLFDSATSGGVGHLFATDPAAAQSVYDDVSTDKDLVSKIAGNDPTGQHEDWSTDFVGWPHPSVTTPESLVRLWFSEIDAAAVAWSNGAVPLDPAGDPVPAVFVSPDGLDRQQLLQKFLLGAVAFSQGADDYLDDDVPGSGLLSPHGVAETDKPYSTLEHAWDEAFGYFGAARDLPSFSDEGIADPTYADTWTADGAIDLTAEVNWGHAQNAAKRDLGAVTATDLTAEAWAGFAGGRALLGRIEGEPSAEQLAELKGHRDRAVAAWEAAIAATVVHYVNDTLREMNEIGTPDYSFASHAKAWSELKGFALSLQFNPRSPLSDADFATLHDLLGTAPALADAAPAALDGYRADLRAARQLVGDAYGFDPANLGDDDGEGGW